MKIATTINQTLPRNIEPAPALSDNLIAVITKGCASVIRRPVPWSVLRRDMSKKDMSREPQSLTEVKVEGGKGKKMTRGNRENSDFVYVNSAFVGSVNSVHNVNGEGRVPAAPAAPITSVYREQYWACSRWPYTQRVLAITVGILLGALIGLCLSFFLGDDTDTPGLGPIFTRHVPD